MAPRRLVFFTVLTGALALAGPVHAQSGLKSQQQSLRAAVSAEEQKIAATQSGLADAQQRLNTLTARADHRQQQLSTTQTKLVDARIHLTTLQVKETRDKKLLAANLLASYKSDTPTFVAVVMDAQGFNDLLERFDFFKRVAARNANILDITQTARADVDKQTVALTTLRGTYASLAKDANDARDEADVIRDALAHREAAQLQTRDGAQAQLAKVNASIKRIEARRAAAARAAAIAATATREAPQVSAAPSPSSAGGGGGGSDDAIVARVIAGANQIAGTPYIWGGGHGSFNAAGYDCSGSVSYALAAGGLLSSPLDSTGFESWGDPGPGRRITVYANAVHAWMIVDGRRYDTSALSAGGTRWTSQMRSSAGFVARHPPGL